MENQELHPEPSKLYKGRLYKQGAMIAAGLFGGAIASAYVIAHNFKVLGERGKMYLTWIITFLLIVAGFIADEMLQVSSLITQFIALILFLGLMNWLQGSAIDKYIEEGHEPFSNWKGLRIGLVCLVIIWGIIFSLSLFLQFLS